MLTEPNEYERSVRIALDRFIAAVLFNEPEVTVSSLCWLVRTGRRDNTNLASWQVRILWYIGKAIDRIWPEHLGLARANDIAASSRARRMLGALTK